jgi:hypothetical protein
VRTLQVTLDDDCRWASFREGSLELQVVNESTPSISTVDDSEETAAPAPRIVAAHLV